MAAASVDMKLEQGSTYRRRWQFRDKTTQVPIDLTGATIKLSVRRDKSSTVTAFYLTSAAPNGLGSSLTIAADPTQGYVDLVITDDDLSTIKGDVAYFYMAKITWADGSSLRVRSGNFYVSGEV